MEDTASPGKRSAPFCWVTVTWCFQAFAMQSEAQSLKAHSRCHWGLHQLNPNWGGGTGDTEAKLLQLPPTVKDPTTVNGLIPTCLMEVSTCTRRCEFPQYICEALNRSHYTHFPHYPLISPEKGSSDLQIWLHRGTQRPAAERCDPQAADALLAHTAGPSHFPALSYLLEGSDAYVLHQHLMETAAWVE